MEELVNIEYEPLLEEIKDLIHQKQYQVLKQINAETINLYWEIGEEIYLLIYYYFIEDYAV